MSLVINTNTMASKTARNLNKSYDRLDKSVERLSTGLRINSAADDAAGLAIREQMRSEISALSQGIRNAEDGISAIQTAEGSMEQISNKLTRMKELAEQAATGTYTDVQRMIIHSEFSSVASEIDRISASCNFNGINLLDGNVSMTGYNGYWTDSNTWNSDSDYWTNASGWEEADGSFANNENDIIGGLCVHFGPTSDRGEDYYFIRIGDLSTQSLFSGTNPNSDIPANSEADVQVAISTQAAAQRALNQLTTAILRADNARASLGASQNRLESTIEALSVQSENLSASESQISDVDIATEMTEYVKYQVLANSGVSMLSQANALPQMALQIIGE